MLSQSESEIIERLRDGGEVAMIDYFAENRGRLREVINRRITPKLAARVDGSDVLQEAFLKALQQFPKYIANPQVSAQQWLYKLCTNSLAMIYKTHAETQKRDIARETQSLENLDSDIGFEALQHSNSKSPSSVVARCEMRERILSTIREMSEGDRAILLAHHIEEQSLREAAAELQITYDAAKKRYRRALQRLINRCKELGLFQTFESNP